MSADRIVQVEQNAKLRVRTSSDQDRNFQGRCSSLGDKPSNARPPRTVLIRKLCAVLVEHLDAGEPRIPVQPTIVAAKRNLLRELKRGNFVTTPPVYFTEILTHIYWTDAPPDAERCGLPLLMCMGSLGEAMNRYELYQVPVSRAGLILLDFYDGADLRFTRRGGQWWVKSTSMYEARFGTTVRVRLPYAPPENPLDLDDLLDA